MPEENDKDLQGFAKLLSNKYYIDEIYEAVITKPLNGISSFVYKYIDQGFIDKLVNGTGTSLNGFSGVLRFVQTGNIGGYIFSMVIGIIVILVLTMIL
jgi:NADH-quinone oxidoreductase subunit L